MTPEDLVLNSTAESPALTDVTLSGTVRCATCAAETPMLVEVADAAAEAVAPLAVAPFDQLGAYEVTVRVAPKTNLVVRARVFAPGGILIGQRPVEVPEGSEPVSVTVDLTVP